MQSALIIMAVIGAELFVFFGAWWAESRFERWDRRQDEKILARHRENAVRLFDLQTCPGCASCEPRQSDAPR